VTIHQNDLRHAAQRHIKSYSPRYGQRTAFLCHSHKDRALAEGLQVLLRDAGVDLYIDWQDETMPEKPSRETADRIRRTIADTNFFLYLATSNSAASKWCPWELGFADGKKSDRFIFVIPTRDAAGGEHGNEYVHLYRRIDVSSLNAVTAYEPGAFTGVPVRNVI
jgi:hypothetical protein